MTVENQDGIQIGPTLETLEEGPPASFEEINKETVDELNKPAEETPEGEPEAEPEEAPEGEPEDNPEEQPEEGEGEESESEEEGPSVLEVDKFAAEWLENGELSEESRAELDKELESRGLPKDMADFYFEGVKAIHTLRGMEVHKLAGGEEEYQSIVKWGQANLSDKQRAAFDKAVDAAIIEGDGTALGMMIESVKAQMGGVEPNYLGSGPKNVASVAPFKNASEMTEAMRDPRYRSDPAYVKEVEQRLAISEF